jgi:predicted ATPase/DNA-binding SARP family transcriptional activator
MAPAEADRVEFGILGPLEVRVGGDPVPVRQGLARSVLLSLLLRSNLTVSTELLIDDLYGEDLPAHPLNALQVQVSNLRKVLADAGVSDLLRTEATGYRLVVARTTIDAGRFEALLDTARGLARDATPGSVRAALDAVDEALALWRGEPLEDVGHRDFAAGEIARLAELRSSARELRAELHLTLGHHREIVPDLAALVEEHPLRERAHELLMLALYRAGRQAEALREYEATRRALADELGLDPGPEIRRLERAILDQDPTLDWAAPSEEEPGQPVDRAEAIAVAPLPAPIAGLIGRADDLSIVRALLERSRAVTLTGPGGSGKTRLAIQHALDAGGNRWFVDLGPLSDRISVFNEVASAFGVTLRAGEERLSGVAALAPRGLLVLDTCEHVIEAAAEVMSELLHLCPDLRVLATSRRPLEVTGELVWPVEPLALPPGSFDDVALVGSSPAVQLFLERARAARPTFELTNDNAATVAAICRALDGLPLSIELAAARLDVLSPADLLGRLDDRFSLLNAGSRSANARQRTLRAALDWSYELLDTEERLMFQRLAVLPGPFSLDLASALVDGAVVADPVELLRSLVRQSMVTRHGEEQFAILDTLQDYAGQRSDGAEVVAALRALTVWARDIVEERDRAVRTATQLEALAALRRDLPNLRASLQWSLAEGGDAEAGAAIAGRLNWFWHLTGMYEEGYRWSVMATEVPHLSPIVRLLACIGAGLHATALGLLDAARAFLDDAVSIAQQMPEVGFERRARAHRGDMEWWFGDPDAAEADLLAAIASSGTVETGVEEWVQAFAKLHLGRVRLRQERYPDADALFDEAHTSLDRIGDAYLSELELRFRARGASLQGDPALAVELAGRSLRQAEVLNHTEGIAISLLAVGEGQRELGDHEEATKVLRRAVEFGVAADHIGSVCQALALLAALEADTGNREGATKLVDQLLRAQATAGLPILTPGGVVQKLVADLLGGEYPKGEDGPDITPAQGRQELRSLALAYLG